MSNNISKTIYTGFASKESDFDINEFIMSILLFDSTLIANSEILPKLVHAIGIEGLHRLVEEDYLSVVGGGPSAQATLDYKKPGPLAGGQLKSPLQYGCMSFYSDSNNAGNTSDQERLLMNLMSEKDGYALNQKDAEEILNFLLPSQRIIHGSTLSFSAEFLDDVTNKQGLISSLLLNNLAKIHNVPFSIMNVELSIEALSKYTYQVHTNLDRLLSKEIDEVHELLKNPFFAITGTNLQLLRMKAVQAAAGLSEIQSEIISQRVDYLSKMQIESDSRPKFTRVCSITDTPRLPANQSINVGELITLRKSPEAHAFRDWLQNSQQYSDHEIKEITSNWKRKIGELLSSKYAKEIRWLSSTGAGVLIGDGAGTITSGIDYFLDKFFPDIGPIGFITGEYKRYIRKQK